MAANQSGVEITASGGVPPDGVGAAAGGRGRHLDEGDHLSMRHFDQSKAIYLTESTAPPVRLSACYILPAVAVYEEFVAAIRHRLAEEGISARGVALRAGLPIRSVNGILEGHVPSVERAAEVAAALGLEFYIGPPRTPAAPPRAGVMIPGLRDLEAGAKAINRFVLEVGGNPIPDEAGGDPLPDESGGGRAPVTVSDTAGSPSATTDPDRSDGAPGEYLEAAYASEVRASAGGGEWVFEESADFRVRLRRSALPRWVNTRDLVCIRVSGDSMEPGIRDGDLLAIDHSRIEPTDNRKFAVSTDDGLVVKRLLHTGSGWELASDNPRRASRNRPMRGDDRIVGQVAWNGPPLPGMVAPRDTID